jgi:hypothetical protein
MTEKKIDQILEAIYSLKEGQQKDHNLIQKNGIELEKIKVDVKAVSEGHQTIRSEMQQGFASLGKQINENKSAIQWLAKDLKDVKVKVDKIERTLEEHVKLPAHI